MSELPKSVTLVEEGPREGFQSESVVVDTRDKVLLIDKLSETGLQHIEVTSFVSPKMVPQMADAGEVSALFSRKPNVLYSALTFSISGIKAAHNTGKYDDLGPLLIIASDTVSMSNLNKTTSQSILDAHGWTKAVKERGYPLSAVIANAFGCNIEGDIPPAKIMDIIVSILNLSDELGLNILDIGLADTVGVANPLQIKGLIYTIRNRFSDINLYLHLHDTRGTGLANVFAGLEMGISRFDCSIGGLGGCPYAHGSAGNVPTEDVALMCEEMGINTGLDLNMLFNCSRLAEQIVGHSLPGKAKTGGLINHATECSVL